MAGFSCSDLQLVVLAGGRGTRLAEETQVRPKPMVEVGGAPILWHVIRSYAGHGVRDVVVCLGYLGYQIKEFFANMRLHTSDVTVELGSGDVTYLGGGTQDMRVTLIDTGNETMTGGRLLRVREHVKGDRPFFFTYGDGLSDVDFPAQLAFHQGHGRHATLASVAPPGKFGALEVAGDGSVSSFVEKPSGDGGRVNGGFFVMQPEVFGYLEGDSTTLEAEPLQRLAAEGQLMAWRHDGYWRPMDTLRDKLALEADWGRGAPWKSWDG